MAEDINITQKLDKAIAIIVKRSQIDKSFLHSRKTLTYSEFLSNKMLMIHIIREGIPYSFFNLIQQHSPFGIAESEVIALMRKELKRSSFNLWRKRVNSGVSMKHLAKRSEEVDRFKCTRQRAITMNKISKR